MSKNQRTNMKQAVKQLNEAGLFLNIRENTGTTFCPKIYVASPNKVSTDLMRFAKENLTNLLPALSFHETANVGIVCVWVE